MSDCAAFVGYADGFKLRCDRSQGHQGSHHDPIYLLEWGPAATTIDLPPDDRLRLA